VAGEVYQRKHQEQLPDELLLREFGAELRQKIIFYFESRRLSDAEDLTHEVFVRISKRLKQGVAVNDLSAYAFGVARLVYKEALRKSKEPKLVSFSSLSREQTSEVNLVQAEILNPETHLEREELSQLLELCLDELSPWEQELLVRYCSVASKKVLASEMGISASNLRIMVHRIRVRLKKSLQRKLKRRDLDWRA